LVVLVCAQAIPTATENTRLAPGGGSDNEPHNQIEMTDVPDWHHHHHHNETHKHPHDTERPELPAVADTCGEGNVVCIGSGMKCVAGECVCRHGFSGPTCTEFVGCSDKNYCSGHGVCNCSESECQCQCRHGWLTHDCSVPLGCECPNHCSGHGNCLISDSSFTCECNKGYLGTDCSQINSTFCLNGCSGKGRCNFDTGECLCLGAKGLDCSEILQGCLEGCRHGKCVSSDDFSNSSCVCDEGYDGVACDQYDHQRDPCGSKNSLFCSGHGVCVTLNKNEKSCICEPGFSTHACNKVVLPAKDAKEGCFSHCSSHGTCNSSKNKCECNHSWDGDDCTTPKCPMHGNRVCSDHGVCEPVPGTDYSQCKCDTCYSGDDCSVNEVEHCPALCNQRGQCKCNATIPNGKYMGKGRCDCNAGWKGDECEQQDEQQQEEQQQKNTILTTSCCPNDCSSRGTCSENCICSCDGDWTGNDCSTHGTPTALISSEQAGFDVIPDLLQLGESASDDNPKEDKAKVRHSMALLWN